MRPVRRLRSLTLLGVLILVGCGGDETAPDEVSITLTPAATSLFVGQTTQLSPNVTGAPGATVTYAASPAGIVTVSGSGLVTAVGLGTATVTATVQGDGASATAQVTVDPSSIVVTPSEGEVAVGETLQLAAAVTGGTGHTVDWSSGDENVATVDGDGLVTGVGAGEVDVTASVAGQAGVSDAASVTVTEAPPEVVAVQILDAAGEEADLSNVVDVLRFVMDIEGAPGSEGEIEILFDGELAHTESFTIEPPFTGGPARAGLVRKEFDVNASPISVVDGELIQEQLGATSVEAFLKALPGRVPIDLGDGAADAYFNPSSKIFIRGVEDLGSVITLLDGRRATNGAQVIEAQIVPTADIARVEVLVGGSTTVYGADAVAGVVNFIVDDREGEGETEITSVSAFDEFDQSTALSIGDPKFIINGPLGPFTLYDKGPPTFTGQVTLSQALTPLGIFGDGEIGEATGTSPYSYTDLSGYEAYVEFWPGAGDWSLVSSSAQLSSYDGGYAQLRTCARDPWEHEYCETFQGPSGPGDLGIDQTPGLFDIRTGSGFVQDLQKGLGPDARIGYTYTDPPGSFGSYASGGSGNYLARVRRDFAGGTEYVWGGAESYVALDDILDPNGWGPDFDSWGSGEFTFDVQTLDEADNLTTAQLRFSASYTDPLITDFQVSGTFEPWDQLVYDFEAEQTGGAELLVVAGGLAFNDVLDGEPLTWVQRWTTTGVRFDDDWTTSFSAVAWAYELPPQYVETTSASYPHGPTGEFFPVTYGFGAALNSGGLTGLDTYPFTGLAESGPSYGVGGTDGFINLGGPSTLDASATGTYRLEAYSTGEVSIGRARLAAFVELSDDLVVAVPIGEPVEGVEEDFISYRRTQWSADFNPMAVGLTHGVRSLFWLGYPKDLEVRNSVLYSREYAVTVRKDF